MRSRTRAFALLASVLLHAALLLLFARLYAPPAPTLTEPIEISVHYLSPAHPQQPEPEEQSAPPPSPEPERRPEPKSRPGAPRQASPTPGAARKEETRAGGGESGTSEMGGPQAGAGQQTPAGGAATRPGRAPDATELDLSIHSDIGSLALGSGGGRGQGQTWRNEPGGFPDPDAVRAAGAAEGKRNIDGWLADGLATSRASNGADNYFLDLGKSLEKAAAINSQSLLSGDPATDLLAAYQDGASRYAKTGNPYAEGAVPGPAPHIDGDRPLAQNAERFQGAGLVSGPQDSGGLGQLKGLVDGNVGPGNLKMRGEMARSLRDFAEGKFGNGLLAIVELRQGADGHLLQLTLREPSGNAAFDAHVLRSAPQALSALGPPPAKGIGIHPEGLRSTWSFEGRIVYKRKLADMSLKRDGWYLALMGLAGLSTGTFDETTGEVEIPDFRHPELKLKVKLLKVY